MGRGVLFGIGREGFVGSDDSPNSNPAVFWEAFGEWYVIACILSFYRSLDCRYVLMILYIFFQSELSTDRISIPFRSLQCRNFSTAIAHEL
jgi:hypothetical protein